MTIWLEFCEASLNMKYLMIGLNSIKPKAVDLWGCIKPVKGLPRRYIKHLEWAANVLIPGI